MNFMLRTLRLVMALLLLSGPLLGQGRRLWVLRPPGEMVEYDPATFEAKQTVKVPAEALQSPERVRVNRIGQILFASAASLPLGDEDVAAARKVWFWNGHTAVTIDQGVTRQLGVTGSNQAVTEVAP